MRYRTQATVVLAIICWTLAGCGPEPNANSGNDHRRSAAMPMDMGGMSDDKVDPGKGDATDWKKFNLVDDDTVTLNVYFDNPEVEATVQLRDAFGSAIKKCVKEESKDCKITVDLRRGDFFIGIHSDGGASVYTMTVELGSGKIAGSGGYSDPRPE